MHFVGLLRIQVINVTRLSCQVPNLKKFQLAWTLCNQSVSFKLQRKQEALKNHRRLRRNDFEPSSCKDISVDAVVAAVLPELDGNFTLKEEQ